jgi:hypothetical protein
MLTNTDKQPAEESFCDENKKALKPPTAERYKNLPVMSIKTIKRPTAT